MGQMTLVPTWGDHVPYVFPESDKMDRQRESGQAPSSLASSPRSQVLGGVEGVRTGGVALRNDGVRGTPTQTDVSPVTTAQSTSSSGSTWGRHPCSGTVTVTQSQLRRERVEPSGN